MLVVAGEITERQFKLPGNISIKAGQQVFPSLFCCSSALPRGPVREQQKNEQIKYILGNHTVLYHVIFSVMWTQVFCLFHYALVILFIRSPLFILFIRSPLISWSKTANFRMPWPYHSKVKPPLYLLNAICLSLQHKWKVTHSQNRMKLLWKKEKSR
jgi:predicted membrane protein